MLKFMIAISATMALAIPANAQPAKRYDSIAVFEHCAKIENAVHLYILAWQVETPKAELVSKANGDRARIAIINDIYDSPARGRTKSDIVRKWEQRCVADPEAFGFKP